MKLSTSQNQASSRRSGFTLIETMVAMSILSVISLGFMEMYVTAARLSSRTTAEMDSTEYAIIAMRHVSDITRQAYYFSLPNVAADNGKFTSDLATAAASVTRFGGYTASTFLSSSNGATCNTAMFVLYPNIASNCTVVNGAGHNISLPNYDRTNPGTTFLILYRSTPAGVPAPTNGACLWETGTDNGMAVDQAIVRNVDPNSWNAVEFERPIQTVGSTTSYIDNQVDVRVVCGEYSAINGVQTSETTNGSNTTQLVGKCIAVMDYNPNGGPTLSTSTQTGGFQAS